MSLRIVGFVQGRMGSQRLPGKVMLDVEGKPMLARVWERVQASRLVDEAVMITSTDPSNECIVNYAKENNIPYFAGEEQDLIERFYGAAKAFNADILIRVTGDCPLVDPNCVDEVIQTFKNSEQKLDYVSNSRPNATYPHGFDVELFTLEVLEQLRETITDPLRREWLTTNLFENPDKYCNETVQSKEDYSNYRLTVDYQSDLDLVRDLYRELGNKNSVFGLKEILELFKQRSDLKGRATTKERHEEYDTLLLHQTDKTKN